MTSRYYQRNNIKYEKNVHVLVAEQKKLLVPVAGFLCPSRWTDYT